MDFSLNKSVSSSYRHLAIVFFLMATILTVVRGLFHDLFGDDYLLYLFPLAAPMGALFLLFMVRLVHNLGVNKRYVQFILFLLASSVGARIISIFLVEDVVLRLSIGVLSSCLLLVLQVICVYFMSVNLFIENNPIKEKLWASVCVYFMIGATFGTVYSLLLSLNPSGLGVELTTPADIYIIGLFYSLNVISGIDPVFENASSTIKMTSVLESIFVMLFMVILIGRLLGSKD